MQRYPPTSDKSLTVSTAADRLLVAWATQHASSGQPTVVLHDRFGAVALRIPSPVVFLATFHSQETALSINAEGSTPPVRNVLQPWPPVSAALIRVPKSLDLFEWYLERVATHATPDTVAAAGFMTRHFTPRMLQVAGKYAAFVEQSRATSKARLLILKDFREGAGAREKVKVVTYGDCRYEQLPGVFSGSRVDQATAFLLTHWPEGEIPRQILDVGCGSGIIGHQLLRRYPAARLTAVDDSILAVESARRNLAATGATVLYGDTLDGVERGSQDLIVTNPPFHFGYENNIEVSLSLFRQASERLRSSGRLVIVANRHLNYATHLTRLFGTVRTAADNGRFVIYVCHPNVQKDL